MTVLLIDDVGHIREWEIPTLVPVLFVPVPVKPSAEAAGEPIAPINHPVMRFEFSDEPSYPPVYRLVRA